MSGYDLTAWWAPALAFVAGVVSFASPCVLPLVPGYLSFVSASSGREAPAGAPAGGRPVAPILLFVLGFSVVFSSLGAFAGTLVPLVRSETGQRVAGVVVLLAGVAIIAYALRIGGTSLYAERRPFLSKIRPGRAMASRSAWRSPPRAGARRGPDARRSPGRGRSRGAAAVLLLARARGAVPVGGARRRWAAPAPRRSPAPLLRDRRRLGGLMAGIGLLLASGLWIRLLGPLLRLVNRFEPPI